MTTGPSTTRRFWPATVLLPIRIKNGRPIIRMFLIRIWAMPVLVMPTDAGKKNFNLLNTHGEGFIEGNALNYSFYVPQDVDNMICLMGGNKSFVSKLDSLFTMHLPAEFFARDRGCDGGRLAGRLCAWQRTEPSYPVPVCLDLATLENAILAA